jgi:hypothetical protein
MSDMNIPLPNGKAGLRRWVPWLAAVVLVAAVLVVVAAVSPAIQINLRDGYGVGLFVVALGVIASVSALPRISRRDVRWLALPLSMLAAANGFGWSGVFAALVVTVALLWLGGWVGAWVGGAIEHPGQLLFVALLSSFADVVSVKHPSGVSAAIAESETALSLLALPWPMLGTPSIEPFLGVGDVVFTALYVSAARAHGLSLWKTQSALLAGFVVTTLLVLASETAIPALPLLGVAMLVAHREVRTPREADRRVGWMVIALAAVVATVLFATARG